jgi:hypothetical protein
MSNQLYQSGAQAILNGQVNWMADNIRFDLLLSSYVPDLVNHRFYSDIAASAVNARMLLTSKTSTAGVAAGIQAAGLGIISVVTIGFVVFYKDTGTDATSPLIALFDTATGLPFSTSGGPTITVNFSGSGWFKI